MSTGPSEPLDVEQTLHVDDTGAGHDAEALTEGETIDRYVVLRRLGSGGMGAVYLAYDPNLDRQVALKLLTVGYDDGATASRLEREAVALARLSHPNVVSVHDVGTHRGRPFITMEYVQGQTLQQWLNASSGSWKSIVGVLMAAGRGLAAAHAAGLVHRDFKPGNVMVGDDARVRVLDFGLARPATAGFQRSESDSLDGAHESSARLNLDSELTRPGLVLGTPGYMAPEQMMGAHVDARTDQFAFCVVAYRALFGARPFEGKTTEELRVAIEAGRIRSIPTGSPVPRAVRRAIVRGLAAAPARRFDSMDALLAAIGKGMRTRRRRVTVGSVGLGLVTAIALWSSDRSTDPCASAGGEMTQLWSAQRRAQLKQAFLAVDRSYASGTAEQVLSTLDAYATEWTQVRVETCEATHVHKRQSEALMDRRIACLDERRRTLSALLSLYETVDVEALEGASQAVASLPSPEDCSANRLADARVEAPPPEVSAQVAALQDRLAEARALVLASRSAQALEVATELLPDVEAVAYDPLTAATLLGLAAASSQTAGSPEQGLQWVERALELAERSGDELLALEALVALVRQHGTRLANTDVALWLADYVEGRGDRMGMPQALRCQLVQNRGTVLFQADRVQEARQAFRAIMQQCGELPRGRYLQLDALQNLAITYGRENDLKESTRLLAKALLEAERLYGSEHPRLAALHTNLAVNHNQQDEHEAALEHAAVAERLWKLDGGDEAPSLGIVYQLLTSIHTKRGEYERARTYALRAIEVQRKSLGEQHPVVGTSLNNLGSLELKAGRAHEALDLARQALAIWEKSEGPQSRRLPAGWDTEGAALLELGRPQEAREVLARAYQSVRQLEQTDLLTGQILFGYGRSLWATANDDAQRREALELVEEAETILSRSGPEDVRAGPRDWLAEHAKEADAR